MAEPVASTPLLALTPASACPQAADPLLDSVLGVLFATLRSDEHCLRLSLMLPADYQPGSCPSSCGCTVAPT